MFRLLPNSLLKNEASYHVEPVFNQSTDGLETRPTLRCGHSYASAWNSVFLIILLGLTVSPALGQEDNKTQPPPPGFETGIKVTDRGRVQLHVADMPLATALRLLSVQSERNIIASPNVRGTVTANLYNVTFEEALDAILHSNGAGYRASNNFIYVYTNEELAVMSGDAEKPVTRVFVLSYITSIDAQTYLTPLLGDGGKIAVSPAPRAGIASEPTEAGGQSSAANDVIVITTTAAKMQDIEKVLKEVDVRPRQVLIEATVVRAELKDDNALGVDFTLVGGVDLEMLGATSQGGTQIQLGTLPTERLERFNGAANTGFTDNVPNGGLRIGVIKDKVAVFLKALDELTNTTVLANPKVLALNKQKGQVIVGRRDGYLTTTVTETQTIQKVEFLETGTQLLFRPFIGNDGYIRVELHPEDSVGVINAQGLPSEQTTEVTTNVLIRDGETILIGGLFREVSTAGRSQIPGLGGLPGVGALFRSTSDATSREEVIILLTVHIVKDTGAYADASRASMRDAERLRVGLRKGMQWHGAERLAQWHYARAIELNEQGKRDAALWHLDSSLRNVPNYAPAIDMRETMLQRVDWDHESTRSRDFVYRLIAAERGYPINRFNRPEPAVGE